MRALVSCRAGCLPTWISVLSRSRSASLRFTTYLFTAIRFAATKHFRRCGAIDSEIDREINDGAYWFLGASQVMKRPPLEELCRLLLLGQPAEGGGNSCEPRRPTHCEHAGLVALLVLDTTVLKQALKGLPIGRVVVIPRQGRLAVGRRHP
jgi:hypothetical protein